MFPVFEVTTKKSKTKVRRKKSELHSGLLRALGFDDRAFLRVFDSDYRNSLTLLHPNIP